MKERLIMNKKRLISIIISVAAVLALAVCMFTLSVSAQTIEGKCGSDITYTLDLSTGVMLIRGNGDMWDYNQSNTSIPWISESNYIKKVVIESGVTGVGSNSFGYCPNLEECIFPDTLERIGEYAFSGCSKLTELDLPEGLLRIDNGAFRATGVTEVTLPEGLEYIGNSAFAVSVLLERATIPDSVTYMGYNVFMECAALKEVKLSSSLNYIPKNTFMDCTALTEWEIPNYIELISDGAFYGCESLQEMIIPQNVTEIGDDAFRFCSSLRRVMIPESVTVVGGDAFDRGEYGTYIFCAAEAKPDGWDDAWHNMLCTVRWGCVIADNGLVMSKSGDSYMLINRGFCTDESLTVPGSINGIPVNTVGQYVFQGDTTVKSVVIESGVTKIDSSAFYGCSSLSSATLPDGLVEIGSNAFLNCTALENINIPDGVTKIKSGAFAGCKLLTDIYIPDSVAKIESDAFVNCTGLTIFCEVTEKPSGWNSKWNSSNRPVIWGYVKPSEGLEFTLNAEGDGYIVSGLGGCTDTEIIIPENYESKPVVAIGDSAFLNKNEIVGVRIPDSVTVIGNDAFRGCYQLASVTFPASLKEIGKNAFEECYALSEIALPDGLISIGEWAFRYCNSIKTVTVPDSVKSIGLGAFSGISNIESITLPFVGGNADAKEASAVTLFGYIFGNKSYGNAKRVQQYYGRDSFNDYTYYYIPTALKTVVLTGGEIFYGSFYGCESIESISVGEGATSVGANAFCDCYELKNVILPEGVKRIEDNAFSGCYALVNITIPSSIEYISSGLRFWSQSLSGYEYGGGVYFGNENDKYILFVGAKSADIQEIEIVSGTRFINCGALQGHNSIKSITLPATVVQIGLAALVECPALESLTVEEGNPAYASVDNCIIHKESKTLVLGCKNSVIPTDGSVTVIGVCAFSGAVDLKEINIPDSVTRLEEGAFYASGLESVVIPDSVESVGYSVFMECGSLKSVHIGAGLSEISDSMFSRCSSLESIVIPDNVTTIGQGTFYMCENLSSVTLPETLKELKASAFSACHSLTVLVIPASIEKVGRGVVFDCPALEAVYYVGSFYDWDSKVNFEGDSYDELDDALRFHPTHSYTDTIVEPTRENGGYTLHVCSVCGYSFKDSFTDPITYVTGDVDGVEGVDANDAIYLLYNVFFGEEAYPIDQPCDFNGDGTVDANDAIYLLYYVFFGEKEYPLS